MRNSVVYLLIIFLLLTQYILILSSLDYNLSNYYLPIIIIGIVLFVILLNICSLIVIDKNRVFLAVLLLIWAFAIGVLLGLGLPKRIAYIGWAVVLVPILSSLLFAFLWERRRKHKELL